MSYNDLSTVKKINGMPVDLNYFAKVTENDEFFKNIADLDEDLSLLNRDILPVTNNAYSLGSSSSSFLNGYISNLVSSALSLAGGSGLNPALKIGSAGLASLSSNELSVFLSNLEVLKLSTSGMLLKAANNIPLRLQNIQPGSESLWLLGADQSGFAITDSSISPLTKVLISTLKTALFTDLLLPNGTEAEPSVSFNADPSTGIYKDPSGPILFFSTSGSNKLSLSSAALEVLSDKIVLPSGSLINPSLTFTGSPNSGLSCLADSLSVLIMNNPVLTVSVDGTKLSSEGDLKTEMELHTDLNFPRQVIRRAGGSKALPTALGEATDIYSQTFESYTDTGFVPVAEVAVFTQDDHSTGAYGTAMMFSTTRKGENTLEERLALGVTGISGVHVADSFGLTTGTFATAGSGYVIDVSNISKLMIDATAGNILIEGFAGGKQGQMLYIYKKVPNNTFTLVFNSATASQKVLLKGSVNYVNTNDYGGVTLAFDQGTWREVSRS